MNQRYLSWLIPSIFTLWLFFVLATFFVVQKPFGGSHALAAGRAFLDLAASGWVALVGWGLGVWLLHRLLPAGEDSGPTGEGAEPVQEAGWPSFEVSVLGMGLGLGLIGLLSLAVGLLGLFRPMVIYTLMGLLSLGLAGWFWHRKPRWQFTGDDTLHPSIHSATQDASVTRRFIDRVNPWAALYLAFIAVLGLLWALLPPADWDGLFYHLTGPKLYLEAGRIVGGIDVPHFNFPSLMEMLFAWTMLLRGDVAAKLLHLVFGLLLTGLVYLTAHRLLDSRAGWRAVIILASMPMLITLASWAYNDLALAFYQLASLYAIIRYQSVMSNGITSNEHQKKQPQGATEELKTLYGPARKIQNYSWLILSAVFAGLAMGMKYTSFVTPLVIVLLILGGGTKKRAGEQGGKGAGETLEKDQVPPLPPIAPSLKNDPARWERLRPEPVEGGSGGEGGTGERVGIVAHGSHLTDHASRFTFYVSRFTFQRALVDLLIFSLITWLVASPWYIKNWVFTGNPVYPFLSEVFGGQFWDSFRAEWYAAAGTGIGWQPDRILALPWLLTLGVHDVNYWDGRTGPLWLLFLPLILLLAIPGVRRRWGAAVSSSAVAALLVYSLAHFGFWTLGVIWSRSLFQSRLLLPGLVGLAPLAGWAWVQLPKFDLPQFSLSRFVNIAIAFTLLLTAVDLGLFTLEKIDPLPYLTGRESPDVYLTRRLGAYYATMQAINQDLPAEARIVFLWEPRSYYCQRDCRPDSILDEFPHLVHQHGTAEAIVRAWREAGITHVLVHRAGLQFVLDEMPETVDQRVLSRLEEAYWLEVIDVAGAYQLYQLVGEAP